MKDQSSGRQMSIYDFPEYLPSSDFPCDTCGYDKIGCCNYPDTLDNYCVEGDKWIPRS